MQSTSVISPIELGRGPTELEIFLEPTCPFSKRAFDKLAGLVSAVGPDKLTVKIRFVSQPWHLFSGIVTRAILAASATKGGTEAALKAMAAVFEHREEFEFENHSAGPNMHRTPTDIIADISRLTGIELSDAFIEKRRHVLALAHEIHPPKRYPRFADVYDQWVGRACDEQRPDHRGMGAVAAIAPPASKAVDISCID